VVYYAMPNFTLIGIYYNPFWQKKRKNQDILLIF